MHRAHVAAFYLSCLKKTDYFADSFRDDDDDDDDAELFVGTLLLHHLMLLQFNAFEVSELRRGRGEDEEQQQTVFIGGSVYPTLALLNHSCDPCVVRWVPLCQSHWAAGLIMTNTGTLYIIILYTFIPTQVPPWDDRRRAQYSRFTRRRRDHGELRSNVYVPSERGTATDTQN